MKTVIDSLCDSQVRYFDTQDGLYDCTWNEANENQLAGASADGSVKLWDMNSSDPFPIANYHEHEQEVSSVDWNIVSKDLFVTASWDHTIKVSSLLSFLVEALQGGAGYWILMNVLR
jgi:WD40 repeat protein